MRICLYTSTALPLLGGQELVVDALARQFQQAGHEPLVLTPRSSRGGPVRDDSLPYRVIRHPRFVSKRHMVWAYAHWLRKLHRQWRFDVVHCHGIYQPAYVAALCRSKLRCPLVVTSHGEDSPTSSHRMATAGLRERHVFALQTSDALVSIGQSTRSAYRELCPAAESKIIDIPNGVDYGRYAAPIARPAELASAIQPGRYALFLGRLVERKGVDVLLRAMSAHSGGGDQPLDLLELVVAGDGAQRQELEQLAAQLGIAQRVHFVGTVSGEMKTYLLQNARFMVCPSRTWEGMPLVILEGFAAGVPVIACGLPGILEWVQDEQTGLIVRPGCAQSLAAAWRRASADTDALHTWGAAARRIARSLDWSAIAERHLELYQECQNGDESNFCGPLGKVDNRALTSPSCGV